MFGSVHLFECPDRIVGNIYGFGEGFFRLGRNIFNQISRTLRILASYEAKKARISNF